MNSARRTPPRSGENNRFMVDGDTNNPSEELQESLLDNALDSLLSSAEAVRRDEGPRSLKEAVVHLGNGTELLLKARLVRKDWALIFKGKDRVSYDELSKGEFDSVDFWKAIVRLKENVGVSIDEAVTSRLKMLRNLRNRLTHFTVTLDSAQAKSLVATAMNFSVEFCEQQNMVSSKATSKISEIHDNLTGLQEFVNDRMKSIREESTDVLPWECPECWQEALVSDGGEADCKFCKRKIDLRELASSHSEGDVEACPECGERSTFAFVLYNNDEARWVCFSCGEGGENYDNCVECASMTYSPFPGELAVCESCQSHIMDNW